MKVFKYINEVNNYLEPFRNRNMITGFVPTMGALHEGHLELLRRCRNECDVVVCSIFVNPLQFGNQDDYVLYPVSIKQDIAMLENVSCDLLFHPEKKEMYPEEVKIDYDFGNLDRVMEGKFRTGHFKGVAVAVKRLFDIIRPQKAYFGEKDFQQLLVVHRLVEIHQLDIKIVPCSIVRETDGLAMSSRNRRLSPEARKLAPAIYRIIKDSATKARDLDPASLKEWVADQFRSYGQMKLEYYELSDANTLVPVTLWKQGQEVIACVAAYLDDIRLIDNIRFFPNFAP